MHLQSLPMHFVLAASALIPESACYKSTEGQHQLEKRNLREAAQITPCGQ